MPCIPLFLGQPKPLPGERKRLLGRLVRLFLIESWFSSPFYPGGGDLIYLVRWGGDLPRLVLVPVFHPTFRGKCNIGFRSGCVLPGVPGKYIRAEYIFSFD